MYEVDVYSSNHGFEFNAIIYDSRNDEKTPILSVKGFHSEEAADYAGKKLLEEITREKQERELKSVFG